MGYVWKREVEQSLKRIEANLKTLTQGVTQMSAELDRVEAQVKNNTDAEQSAILLLGQLSDLIRQNATDPARLNKMADDLDASKQKLAAAVVANTPAAP
jgi:cell division septum initiation protein DivIVA